MYGAKEVIELANVPMWFLQKQTLAYPTIGTNRLGGKTQGSRRLYTQKDVEILKTLWEIKERHKTELRAIEELFALPERVPQRTWERKAGGLY